MKIQWLLTISALGCLASVGQGKDLSSPLQKHQWQDRVIVIHHGGLKAPWLQSQWQSLQNKALENKDRHLVIYYCPEKSQECQVTTRDGKTRSAKLSAVLQEQLRLKQPSITLIGKDGGIKLQKHDFVKPEAVYTLIDGMPMRQQEMGR
ncbi:DUF4174 domain-containing protein [Pseudobacteriovorax antillogorgiicola]|nr:DUF4174 domain-containing protein [Pseudobacteriovorax antillogorgiicola]